MRQFPPGLTGHLTGSATTMCHCWRIRRRDGVILGFTDHDRDIEFDAIQFVASSGLDAGSREAALGLNAPGGEVSGVLSSASLTEADLAAGRYDGAIVETWWVNWNAVSQRALLEVSTTGEVRRTGETFQAELRSLANVFDQQRGRIYQAQCDADLGDSHCGVDISSPQFSVDTPVTGGNGRIEFVFHDLPFDDGVFGGGRFVVLTGELAGIAKAVESHRNQGTQSAVRLWERLPAQLAPGTMVRLIAGCDKRAATCRERFGNFINFRGFPHMPGNDALLMTAATSGVSMDGGSIFR